MKHTPGPWDRGARCGMAGISGVITNNIHVIAPTDQPFVARVVAMVPDNDQHGEANARLIVAAPDLLDALLALRDDPYGCPMCDSGRLRDQKKEHWDRCGYPKLRAAIAKAEGR